MWKKLSLGACLLVALAACASSAPKKPPATAASAAAGCVPEASRLPPSASTCAGFGHSWTQDDIQRTGAADPAQALRLLDPSLTVHGH